MAKEKDYCDYLVGTKPAPNKKKGLLNFLLGVQRNVNYYDARHREKPIRLLWMETPRWSSMRCYPCVLEREGEILVFQSGVLKECKENNLRLVREWMATVDRERLETDFEVEALESKTFDEIFRRYRKEDLERAIAEAERMNGAVSEALPPSEGEIAEEVAEEALEQVVEQAVEQTAERADQSDPTR